MTGPGYRADAAQIPALGKVHRDLAAAAERAEKIAALVKLPENVKFQRARSLVRTALAEAGVAGTIDALVARLLDNT
jgi:hypothetical protein